MARRFLIITLFVVLANLGMGCHKHHYHKDRWAKRHGVPYQNAGDSCSCSSGAFVPFDGNMLAPPEPIPAPKKMPVSAPSSLTGFQK